jgi:hypothetical protein
VLQALRAHDDRFNATINRIELNKARPDQIQVIGVPGWDDRDRSDRTGGGDDQKSQQLALNFSPQPVRKMFTKHPRQPTLLTRIPAGQCPLPTPVNDDRHSGGSSGSTSLRKSSWPEVARPS